jgi:hypothetical protein
LGGLGEVFELRLQRATVDDVARAGDRAHNIEYITL